MAINLHDKYAKQIATEFTTQSLIKGRLSNEYDWDGVKTIKVMTPQTVPLGDYTRSGSNRYGSPVEMEDVVQYMTLTQDKSFALTIDKGNDMDQNGLKAAGKMLKLEIDERAIPTYDAYCFNALATKAGKIYGSSTAITKQLVCDRISDGTEFLDDAEVPQDNRTLFVSNATYKLLKHSDEFMGVESLAEKALAKGQVGLYDNMVVVKVPAGRWPANVNFMIVYKNSAQAPEKINETKLHQDPPGISGNLLEGRFYYDCFVIAAKANGIYVDVLTGVDKGTVLGAPTVAADGTITAATATGTSPVVMYTLDGTDPRYSATAAVYTAQITGHSGELLRAYEYDSNGVGYPSGVAEKELT